MMQVMQVIMMHGPPPRPYSHQPQSSGPPNNSLNRGAQLQLAPEPAPQPSTATKRQHTRDVYFAGIGQPPQPSDGPLDAYFPGNLTLAGIGGQAQVPHTFSQCFPLF